jgi:hypothetical protein
MSKANVHRYGRRGRSTYPTYSCVLWEEDGEWSAHNADLGAWGVGPSRALAIADFVVAAKLMVDYLRSIGEKPPASREIEVALATL